MVTYQSTVCSIHLVALSLSPGTLNAEGASDYRAALSQKPPETRGQFVDRILSTQSAHSAASPLKRLSALVSVVWIGPAGDHQLLDSTYNNLDYKSTIKLSLLIARECRLRLLGVPVRAMIYGMRLTRRSKSVKRGSSRNESINGSTFRR